MITAKELLLAAGWDEERSYDYMRHAVSDDRSIFTSGGFLLPDDNLTNMLIRELSEEQFSLFFNYALTVSWMIGKLTPEQKAAALMETYKEQE